MIGSLAYSCYKCYKNKKARQAGPMPMGQMVMIQPSNGPFTTYNPMVMGGFPMAESAGVTAAAASQWSNANQGYGNAVNSAENSMSNVRQSVGNELNSVE